MVVGFYKELSSKEPEDIYNFLIDTLSFADGREVTSIDNVTSSFSGDVMPSPSPVTQIATSYHIEYSNTPDSEKRILLAHGLFQKDALKGFALLSKVRNYLEQSGDTALVQELDNVVESLRPITVLYKIDCGLDRRQLNLENLKKLYHQYQAHSYDERRSQYRPEIIEQFERISQFKEEDVRENHFINLFEQLKMNQTTHTIKFKNKTKTQEWCTKLSGLNVDDYFKKVFESDGLKGKPDQWIPFSHLIQAEEMDQTESKRQILADYTPPIKVVLVVLIMKNIPASTSLLG